MISRRVAIAGLASAALLGALAPVAEHPRDEWARVMQINLDGTFFCSR
jgi:NAD(P)-dependent dehydrogenase (short-subunit alcohol dehydrogenase family)